MPSPGNALINEQGWARVAAPPTHSVAKPHQQRSFTGRRFDDVRRTGRRTRYGRLRGTRLRYP